MALLNDDSLSDRSFCDLIQVYLVGGGGVVESLESVLLLKEVIK